MPSSRYPPTQTIVIRAVMVVTLVVGKLVKASHRPTLKGRPGSDGAEIAVSGRT